MENFAKDLFEDTKVDNTKLKSMIQEKVLNLVVLCDAKEISDYKILWDTLDCYRCFLNSNFKVYIYDSKFKDNEILKKIIHYYDLEKFVEFLDNDNKKALLTIFLGSDMALLLNDIKDEYINLIDYFMLPCIVTNKDLLKLNDKFFYIEESPDGLASAISVINLNIDYRRELVF